MKSTDPRQEALQLAIARGDFYQALDLLMQLYQHNIVSLCAYTLGNKTGAEDLAQEVFLTAFEALARFRGEANVRAWLYRIAINKGKQTRSKEQRRWFLTKQRQEDIARELYPLDPSGGEEERRTKCIKCALHRLRIRDRNLLQLHYLQKHMIEELAEDFQVAPRTISRWIQKAAPAFRKAYERCLHNATTTP
jgi:RNA polymerase sigma-70 factor, ECF subfamily